MSPLKITLLLNLYSRPRPFEDYPYRQREAPAMRQAFQDFALEGLLHPGIDHATVSTFENFQKDLPYGAVLSDKGVDLVKRLCAVEP